MTYDPKRDLINEARALADTGPGGFGYRRPQTIIRRLADALEEELDAKEER